MPFTPIRIIALDHEASVIHPITRDVNNRTTSEEATLYFELSELATEDWTKIFNKSWAETGIRQSAKADKKNITFKTYLDFNNTMDEMLLRLKAQVSSTNLTYQNQLEIEAREEARKQSHHATLRAMASRLKFD